MASERNWMRMWPLVAPRARRSPISLRRSRTEMTMMLATPTAPTRSATAPRPRNRPLRAPWASAWATRAAEGWLTFDLVRGLRVGGRRQHAIGRPPPGRLGPHVDGGGMAVEAKIRLGGREPDEDRGVDLGGQDGRVEDAGDVEPLVVDPDPLAGVDAVDPEALGGDGAEHGDRLPGRGGVEVAALGELVPTVGGRPRLAAWTLSALVSMEGMRGLR